MEIRIRAWDKEKKIMHYRVTLAPDGWYQAAGEPWENDDKKIIMQFTGLHDKNGKEIWQGDVVRVQHPDAMGGDFSNAVGRVFWDEKEGGFYHGNDCGRPPKRMWEYCEVLGNIYENPELLKKEK